MSRLPHDLSWVVYPKINPTYMYMYMYTSFTMSWYICIKIWMTSDRNKEVWARDLYHSTALLNIIGHVGFMAHGIRPHSTMHGATQHKQGIVKLTKTSNTLQTKNRICNDRHNTKNTGLETLSLYILHVRTCTCICTQAFQPFYIQLWRVPNLHIPLLNNPPYPIQHAANYEHILCTWAYM